MSVQTSGQLSDGAQDGSFWRVAEPVVQSDGMESDPDSRPTYEPMPGSRMARTPEERAEAFAGFPERILELREQRSSRTLSDAEQDELRLLEEILARSAPDLLPPD